MHFLPEKIDNYVVSHSQQEPEILQELTRETWQKVLNPRMLSGAFQGRVLSMISKLIYPKNILEIGTYTGYSALCLAEGLLPGGEIFTIDKNEELAEIQQKYFIKNKTLSILAISDLQLTPQRCNQLVLIKKKMKF